MLIKQLDNMSNTVYNLKKIYENYCKYEHKFNEKENKIKDKLENYINQIEYNIAKDEYNNFNFDLDRFVYNNMLKNIYWILTIEWEKITIHDIENNIWPDELTRKQISNIKNTLKYAYNLVKTGKFTGILTIKLIQKIHKMLTKQLFQSNDKYNTNILLKDKKKHKEKQLNELLRDFNEKIVYRQRFNMKLTDIAIFHLLFLAIQLFWDKNLQTIKVIESLLIQYYYDNNHYLVWMWYYFIKDKEKYFKKINRVLSWKEDILSWLYYYLDSFETMIEYSENLYKVKRKFRLEYILPENRIKFYNAPVTSLLSWAVESDYIILTELITWINTTKSNEVTLDKMLDILWEYKILPKAIRGILCSKIWKYKKDKLLIPSFKQKDYYDRSTLCWKRYRLNEKLLEYYA